MKRLLFSLTFLVVGISTSLAQVSIRASLGYNLPLGSQQLAVEETYTQSDQGGYVTKGKGIYGSFGSGVSARAAACFELNGILGFDFEVGYLAGKNYSATSKSQYSESDYTETNELKSSSIQFAPSLTFTGGTGNVQPFARIGPVVALTTLKGERTIKDEYYDYTMNEETKYSGRMSLGFKGSVGVLYGLSESLQLFAEVDFISMSYAPGKREITAHKVNGEDAMDNLSPEEKKIEYEKEQTLTNEEGEPVVRPTFPMGSIGLQLGVKFSL